MDTKATNPPLIHPLPALLLLLNPPLRYTDLLQNPPVRHFLLRRKSQSRLKCRRGRRGPNIFYCFCSACLLWREKGRGGFGGSKGRKWRDLSRCWLGAWGGFLDSHRPNQHSDKDRKSVNSLFIVCFGVRNTAQLLATGCLPFKGLKVDQMTFSIVPSSYSPFPTTCTHTLCLHACSLL